MKKMLVIALTVVGLGVAWTVSYFGKDAVSLDDNSLLAFVPADTIFYAGATGRDDVSKLMQRMPVFNLTPSQTVAYSDLFELMNDSDSKPAKFFNELRDHYLKNTDGTLGSVQNYLGLAGDGAVALYVHGVFPVLRMQVADPQKIQEHLRRAADVSGWSPVQLEANNEAGVAHQVSTWELSSMNPKLADFQLAFLMADSVATLTLLEKGEADVLMRERLGLQRPQANVADELVAIKKTYGVSDDLLSFLNLQRIAQGVLDPPSNAFGQQLKRFIDKTGKAPSAVSEECRKDYLALAAIMPRWVMGMKPTEIDAGRLQMETVSVLELGDTTIKQQLSKVRGHIPLHTLEAHDKVFGIGLGFSFDNLTAVVQALLNHFTQQSYQCPNLVQAQQRLKGQNPGALAFAMQMMSGVEGVGFSLYDIQWSEGSPMPHALSALLSVSAKNPSAIAAMAQGLPMLAGVTLPPDGQVVDIALPMVPPPLSLKAAIKGQHLVVFAGDVMQHVDALAKEALSPNGIVGGAVDYQRVARVIDAVDLGLTQADSMACLMQQEMRHLFSALDMNISSSVDFDEYGLSARGKVTSTPTTASPLSLPGNYTVDLLGDGCRWAMSGKEEINADGTGTYIEMDEAQQCELYASTYRWTHEGNQMVMSLSSKSRDTCHAEWEMIEDRQERCYLMNVADNSFQCMFSPGEEATLYRYTRL